MKKKSTFKSTITGQFLFDNSGEGIRDFPSNWKALSKEAKDDWNQLAATTCQQVAEDILRVFE